MCRKSVNIFLDAKRRESLLTKVNYAFMTDEILSLYCYVSLKKSGSSRGQLKIEIK